MYLIVFICFCFCFFENLVLRTSGDFWPEYLFGIILMICSGFLKQMQVFVKFCETFG